MIRFIDIRGQGTGAQFAFWDTGTNSFIEVNGDYAWSNLAEFVADVYACSRVDDAITDRFAALCPDWAADGDYTDAQRLDWLIAHGVVSNARLSDFHVNNNSVLRTTAREWIDKCMNKES